jgi:hypothetical protein
MLAECAVTQPDIAHSLRRLLLALVLLGAAGLLVELVLLEHYDSAWKWSPLVLLVVVLLSAAAAWLRPGHGTLVIFRAMMRLCVALGLVGLALHYKGNLEFAREHDPSLSGLALLWKGMRGATPSLAPGALAQLGLLGLIFTYRHPALATGATRTTPRQEIT